MQEEGKKKFNWKEFIAVVALVLLTAVVTWGITYYVMSTEAKNVSEENDATVAHYQAEINSLDTQLKAATVTTKPLTAAMIQSGTYTLGGVKVSLVNGTATVSGNTYTLDTKNVAYNTDKTKAVVVIKETTGTTAVNTYLVSVENKNEAVSQIATATISKDATVSSVAYGTDGKITVGTTTTGATTPTTTTYTVSGTNLVASK